MIQVPVRGERFAALAAFFVLTGHAAQAGVVTLPQWGAAARASHPAAASALHCLEVEEVSPRGREVRFEVRWSRDAGCHGNAATAGTPAPSTPAPAPTPVSPVAAPTVPAPSALLVAAGPSSQTPAAPQAAPASETPPAESAPPALPALVQMSDEAPEESAPDVIGISLEQPQASAPTPVHTIVAEDPTGILPPPVVDGPGQPSATVPEPSSLWLFALGVAAAWRSRRR